MLLLYRLTATKNIQFNVIHFDTLAVNPNQHARTSRVSDPALYQPLKPFDNFFPIANPFIVDVDATLLDNQPWWWVLEIWVNGQPTNPAMISHSFKNSANPDHNAKVRF